MRKDACSDCTGWHDAVLEGNAESVACALSVLRFTDIVNFRNCHKATGGSKIAGLGSRAGFHIQLFDLSDWASTCLDVVAAVSCDIACA